MKIHDRTQTPPQPVKHQPAQKAPEAKVQQTERSKAEAPKGHVGNKVDIKA
jgi:hypothetical protein